MSQKQPSPRPSKRAVLKRAVELGERQPEEIYVFVQCWVNEDTVGSFLANVGPPRDLMSPVFNHLSNLFDWMRRHNWKLDEHTSDGKFKPLRASQIVPGEMDLVSVSANEPLRKVPSNVVTTGNV